MDLLFGEVVWMAPFMTIFLLPEVYLVKSLGLELYLAFLHFYLELEEFFLTGFVLEFGRIYPWEHIPTFHNVLWAVQLIWIFSLGFLIPDDGLSLFGVGDGDAEWFLILWFFEFIIFEFFLFVRVFHLVGIIMIMMMFRVFLLNKGVYFFLFGTFRMVLPFMIFLVMGEKFGLMKMRLIYRILQTALTDGVKVGVGWIGVCSGLTSFN